VNRPLNSSEEQRETAPAAETKDPETEDKVKRPHAHFEHPAEVVIDPLLSKDEKAHALEGMEQDARQLSTAAAEGMTGGEGTGLQDVLAAKEALELPELPPFDLAVSVVLQSFRARLQSTEGSEAHALIARAIEAVEAARGAIGPVAAES